MVMRMILLISTYNDKNRHERMHCLNFPIKVRTKKVRTSSPKVNVYFPVIVQLSNEDAQIKINQAIARVFNKLLVERGFFDTNLVEMQAYYEIKTNERNILSLSLIVYAFTGGAHGMTTIKSLTFDVTTGRQYTLKELFKPNSDYVKRLSDIIAVKLKEWNTPLLDGFKTIMPNQDFYIADHSLVIYFQLYEISPYVAGFPYVPIPIWDIQDIIKPDGPLDKLLSF